MHVHSNDLRNNFPGETYEDCYLAAAVAAQEAGMTELVKLPFLATLQRKGKLSPETQNGTRICHDACCPNSFQNRRKLHERCSLQVLSSGISSI